MFIFYTAYPVEWIFLGRPELFRTPFEEMLICFVPLKMTHQNVSYPLFCPKPNMFRTPQFCNNTDMFRTPPHNLLEQSDLFGTPLPLPTGTGCHNVLWRHVSLFVWLLVQCKTISEYWISPAAIINGCCFVIGGNWASWIHSWWLRLFSFIYFQFAIW